MDNVVLLAHASSHGSHLHGHLIEILLRVDILVVVGVSTAALIIVFATTVVALVATPVVAGTAFLLVLATSTAPIGLVSTLSIIVVLLVVVAVLFVTTTLVVVAVVAIRFAAARVLFEIWLRLLIIAATELWLTATAIWLRLATWVLALLLALRLVLVLHFLFWGRV